MNLPNIFSRIFGGLVSNDKPAWVTDSAAGKRKISRQGLDLVKHFESFFPEAYKDPVGIWTIGYGHTGLQHRDGTVFKGRKVTEAQALELLDYDMNQFEERVNAHITQPLTQNQFDALVSLTYNIGAGAFKNSTLLKLLNQGDYVGASHQFDVWIKAGGQTVQGLVNRRAAEKALFLS